MTTKQTAFRLTDGIMENLKRVKNDIDLSANQQVQLGLYLLWLQYNMLPQDQSKLTDIKRLFMFFNFRNSPKPIEPANV